MSSRKRKRCFKDIKCVFFPDDVEHGLNKAGRDPPSLSSVSSAKSWEKCGDSFLGSPGTKRPSSSGRKLSELRRLAKSPALVQTHCKEEAVDIAWSSSDSAQSDHESQETQPGPQRLCRPTAAPRQSYSRALRMLSHVKEELPVIDTDSDMEESEEEVEKDAGQQISDCDSESSDEKPQDLPPETTNLEELEISGYVSGEDSSDPAACSGPASQGCPLQTADSGRRSVGLWLRSAQAMLQTPQKPFPGQAKTPEDSAKKKRKFQSGGLAERLNRLQCRQRSAISFWRHQSVSVAPATTVDRPGVLVLEVLEVHEESNMRLAHCETRQQPPKDPGPAGDKSARTLVLFNRETAAQLLPAPRDVIHIYPPWQSLSVEGFDCDIILNTHFSQKVHCASRPGDTRAPGGPFSAERCSPYALCETFGLLEVGRAAAEENDGKQGAASDAVCGLGRLSRHCLSLLEAIEGLGQAGSVGQDVEVVVQRVYSVPVSHCPPASVLKSRVPPRSSSAPPPPPPPLPDDAAAEKDKSRLCVLVQDSYGMFSVVQLHLLSNMDALHEYCSTWQGRTCVLRGIKVVQRVTRERRTMLFSLIESLWPPVMPVKDHGNTPSVSTESRPAGPAPSFCYLLSGQESSVEPVDDEPTVSPLYLPPVQQTLRDILQSELKTCRCSFVATVLHKRITKSEDVGQGEVWLVLTDPSLQEDRQQQQPDAACTRTVALCVNASCVLTSCVLAALRAPAACRVSFRDAIKEHGVLLCAEQSVVDVFPAGPQANPESEPRPQQTLVGPVRLDPLGAEARPNSLCSLSGVIVGVDQNTAYSWPACNLCASDNLEMLSDRPPSFRCLSCKSVLDKPDTRLNLEVFLRSSLSNCTLKVKLQQKTITSILNTTALDGTEFPGYDVENVLGREVGPLAVYVRVVTRKPTLCMGLEEICL